MIRLLVRVYAAGLDRGVWHGMRELIEAGKVTAVIARTFRLRKAFGIWFEKHGGRGKIGITV